MVIPNGFDFDREVVRLDERVFRARLESLSGDTSPITLDDLVVAMPARVAMNKAIELGIDSSPASKPAPGSGTTRLTDWESIGASWGRLAKSSCYCPRAKISRTIAPTSIGSSRTHRTSASRWRTVATSRCRNPKFTSGDTDHFPSTARIRRWIWCAIRRKHEGFGNQAIETVWAKLPLAVLEYPVFKELVRFHIPHYISLGDVAGLRRLDRFGGLHQLSPDILGRAVENAVDVLKNHALEAEWVDENAVTLRAFCGIDTVCDDRLDSTFVA